MWFQGAVYHGRDGGSESSSCHVQEAEGDELCLSPGFSSPFPFTQSGLLAKVRWKHLHRPTQVYVSWVILNSNPGDNSA